MHRQRLSTNTMIRAATLADTVHIVDIGEALHEESTYREIPYSRDKVIVLIRSLIQGAGVVFVAEKEGQIVGGIAGGVTSHWFSDELTGFEYSFFVLPEHRHGLVAMKLLLAMKAWCTAKGAKTLRIGITTGINVEGTARFYRHMGFRDAGNLFEMEL
jgi:GNAT superfamily N-acetyltransferase